MEKADKIKMFEMRLEGKTLDEIGHAYGVTRERARQILTGAICGDAAIKRGCDKFIYPALGEWLKSNHVSIGELYEKMGYKSTNTGATRLSKMLNGKANLGLRMSDIKKILSITEMSFEEAFAEKEQS